MPKRILFIQGAGEGAHAEDAKIVDGLRRELGHEFEIAYPAMPNEDNPSYEAWARCTQEELDTIDGPVILAAHSMGGSVLLKCLGEIEVKAHISAIYIMAAPFWGGDGWRYEGYQQLVIPDEHISRLLPGVPIFVYQCIDDEIVPFDHLDLYKKRMPSATFRQFDDGGHQFNGRLSAVAQDIKNL